MGRNNQARRAAKAKARAKQRASQAHDGQRRGADSWRDAEHPGAAPFAFDDAQLAELAWANLTGVGVGRHGDPDAALARLLELPLRTVADVAEDLLLGHVELLWQHGWLPDELHRQARVGGLPAPATRVVELAVRTACGFALARDLDDRWREQAERLRSTGTTPRHGWLRPADPSDPALRAWCGSVADAYRLLVGLPPLDELLPPPGAGADSRPGRKAPVAATADPVLNRVRNLLAKAESTEFEAEAIALTAKAQELITRHAIDTASLDGGPDPTAEPSMVRVPIDAPYADAKSFLLQTIASHSRCRSVFSPTVAMSTVVGYPDDLVAVEILFTSLLVQAQQALAEAGSAAGPGARTRSQSYRSAFLLAYTQRIGDRLAEINNHVFAAAESDSGRFLPVLRSQQDSIEEFMEQRFGDLYSGAVRGGYDPAGWSRGRMAADQAQLAAGDLTGTDDALF